MNDSERPAQFALQVEFSDDIAIIDASGDLRHGPSEVFESAMRKILGRGYRLVVIDFYDNQGLDEERIADYLAALKVLLSSDRGADFAIVKHRDSFEWERDRLISWDWFMHERSYYNRSDAVEGIRKRAGGEHTSTS